MDKELMTSIIAAGSAIFGVAASQLSGIARSVFDKNSERTVLLRSKLEELADNLHRTTEWFEELTKAVSGKDARPISSNGQNQPVPLSSEARRVYVLSLLYFPSMREEAKALFNSTYAFYQLMLNAKDIDQQHLHEVTSNYSAAKKAMDNLIVLEAEKIT